MKLGAVAGDTVPAANFARPFDELNFPMTIFLSHYAMIYEPLCDKR